MKYPVTVPWQDLWILVIVIHKLQYPVWNRNENKMLRVNNSLYIVSSELKGQSKKLLIS